MCVSVYSYIFVCNNGSQTTNDMYEAGVTNDQLNLMNQSDASSQIAVKTPVGMTKRVNIEKNVNQGEVLSSLKCTVTVDSISKKHCENLNDHLFLYKDIVAIPPLGMVDDQIGISKCGLDSALTTAHLNSQTNIKKITIWCQQMSQDAYW